MVGRDRCYTQGLIFYLALLSGRQTRLTARITWTLSSFIIRLQMANPYSSPNSGLTPTQPASSTRLRRCAIILFALPVLAAAPIYLLVFRYTLTLMQPYVGPDHRAGFLDLLYLAIMFCVTTSSLLSGFALLWKSDTFPRFSRAMTIVFAILVLPMLYAACFSYKFYFPTQ